MLARVRGSLSKRTILRHLIEDDQSIRSNNEILASSFHHLFGDNGKLIGDQDQLDLHHQTLNETNIAFRDAKDGGNGLLVGKIVGVCFYPMPLALIQEKGRLLLG